jgi:hypothetical protein
MTAHLDCLLELCDRAEARMRAATDPAEYKKRRRIFRRCSAMLARAVLRIIGPALPPLKVNRHDR